MCALRAHIKPPIFGNIFLRIEKVLTAFSIPEKMFPKLEGLMCALRAHISKILSSNQDCCQNCMKVHMYPANSVTYINLLGNDINDYLLVVSCL